MVAVVEEEEEVEETPENEVQRLVMAPCHVSEKRRDEDADEVGAEVGACRMNDRTNQDEVDDDEEVVVDNFDRGALDNSSEVGVASSC